MKKIISLVLVFVMLASCVTVFGDTTGTVSASKVTAEKGDEVEIEISIANNPGIASASINVGYDSSAVKLLSVTDGKILGAAFHTSDYDLNPYQLSWANDTATVDFTTNGTLAKLKFKVLDAAVPGTAYPITVSYDYDNWDIYNCNVEPVMLNMVAGSITINKQEEPEPPIPPAPQPLNPEFDIDDYDSFAEEIASGKIGNITWTLDEDGFLIIKGEGIMPAFSTGAPWETYSDSIKIVSISKGVTGISNGSFAGCENLNVVAIPDTITTIGSEAFKGCKSLVYAKIPTAVTSIGEDAFDGCDKIVLYSCANEYAKTYADTNEIENYYYDGTLVPNEISLSLADNIIANIFADNAVLGTYDEVKLLAIVDGYRYEIEYDESKECFPVSQISPDLMKKEFSLMLVGNRDGDDFAGDIVYYSIGEYLYTLLGSFEKKQSSLDALYKLVIDVLNYGAAAQLYVNPSTSAGDLVTDSLSAEWIDWRGDNTVECKSVRNPKYTQIGSPTAIWKSANLNLTGTTGIKATFEIASIDGVSIEIKGENGETYTDHNPMNYIEKVSESKYAFVFRQIYATNFDEKFLFTIYKNGQAISDTLSYSVNSYVVTKQSTTNATLKQIVKAVAAYGASAKEYAAIK